MSTPPNTEIPRLHWVNSYQYGRRLSGNHTYEDYRVDPAPLASLVAAAIGFRDDLHERMKAIAEDDQDGPIHLIHLLAACEYAAQDVGGSLPSDGSFPGSHVTNGGFITATVSPAVLPNLVRALRKDGIAAATNLARTYSRRERFRALDVLVHFVTAPITGLQIDLHDDWFRHDDQAGNEVAPNSEEEMNLLDRPRPRRDRWGILTFARRRSRL